MQMMKFTHKTGWMAENGTLPPAVLVAEGLMVVLGGPLE
jgi:hypothetical protein